MSFVAIWRAGERVFIVADSLLTQTASPRIQPDGPHGSIPHGFVKYHTEGGHSAYSIFDEPLLTGPRHFQCELCQKLFRIGISVFAFVGHVDAAHAFIKIVRDEIHRRGNTAVGALQVAASSVAGESPVDYDIVCAIGDGEAKALWFSGKHRMLKEILDGQVLTLGPPWPRTGAERPPSQRIAFLLAMRHFGAVLSRFPSGRTNTRNWRSCFRRERRTGRDRLGTRHSVCLARR